VTLWAWALLHNKHVMSDASMGVSTVLAGHARVAVSAAIAALRWCQPLQALNAGGSLDNSQAVVTEQGTLQYMLAEVNCVAAARTA
jgi:hypothetical protein